MSLMQLWSSTKPALKNKGNRGALKSETHRWSSVGGDDFSFKGIILLLALFISAPKQLVAVEASPRNVEFSAGSISSSKRLSDGIWCDNDYSRSLNSCHIICSGEDLNSLRPELEREQIACGSGQLEVFIKDCDSFLAWDMAKNTFRGNYRMKSLTLFKCRLSSIEQGAFDQQSTKDTIELKIIDSEFKSLNSTVFSGLHALLSFQLVNKEPSYGTAKLIDFLQPMAKTLMAVSLLQRNKQKITIMNPKDWLGGTDYKKMLRLNLSSNTFGDYITAETFSTITNLRELILDNCAISAIGIGTFDRIIQTLEYLDLSNNKLKLLDAQFLSQPVPQYLEILIHNNPWTCTCENHELINVIQDSDVIFLEEPVCASPEEWLNVPLKEIKLNCDKPTITTTAPVITTVPTTTTTTTTAFATETTYATTTTTYTETTTAPITTIVSTAKTPPLETTAPFRTSTIKETTIVITPSSTMTSTTPATATTTSATSKTQLTESTTDTPSSIECLKCEYKQEATYSTVYKQNAKFQILTSTPTSVHALISEATTALNLLYFLENNDTTHTLPDEIPAHTTFDVAISGLSTFHSYLFCLVPIGAQNISPFNCRSHFLEETNQWLLEKDIPWFVCVNVLVATLSVCLGIIAIYLLLRCRPSLIRSHNQLVRSKNDSQVMILFPKNFRNSLSNQDIYGDSTEENCSTAEKCDYMKSTGNKRTQNFNLYESHPPLECAPSVPNDYISDTASTQTTHAAGTLPSNKYKTSMCNIYEEIY